jgi:hypothetical protein
MKLWYLLPINISCSLFDIHLVRMKGLEPPYLTASDPKSDVSTNFTTSGKNSKFQPIKDNTSMEFFIFWNFNWAANVGHFRGKILIRRKKWIIRIKMLTICFFSPKKNVSLNSITPFYPIPAKNPERF